VDCFLKEYQKTILCDTSLQFQELEKGARPFQTYSCSGLIAEWWQTSGSQSESQSDV